MGTILHVPSSTESRTRKQNISESAPVTLISKSEFSNDERCHNPVQYRDGDDESCNRRYLRTGEVAIAVSCDHASHGVCWCADGEMQ
jgi:hypothetical protein